MVIARGGNSACIADDTVRLCRHLDVAVDGVLLSDLCDGAGGLPNVLAGVESATVRDLIRRCWVQDPSERPSATWLSQTMLRYALNPAKEDLQAAKREGVHLTRRELMLPG